MTTHIPLPGSGTLPPLFYAERERGAGGAALPSGISRRNVVTTHIPLFGSGTLPRGAGGAGLPSGISRRNEVTTHIPLSGSGTLPPTHIPLSGSGTLPPLFSAERYMKENCIFDKF